jgi:hypothetical protein
MQLSEPKYCGCDQPDIGYILRSKCPLPEILRIYSIDNIDFSYGIDLLNSVEIKYADDSRIKDKEKLQAFFRTFKGDTYFFIRNDEMMDKVLLEILPEDPLDALTYSCCDDEIECNPLDLDFYIDKRYEDMVMRRTVELLMGVTTPQDRENDDKDRR